MRIKIMSFLMLTLMLFGLSVTTPTHASPSHGCATPSVVTGPVQGACPIARPSYGRRA